MKAISLWQPWASAIPMGLKRFETRKWSTKYRGPLAIHAAKCWGTMQQNMSHDFGMPDLPFGVVVATCDLVGVYSTEFIDMCISQTERNFGDYTPGRYAWMLTNIRCIKPFQWKGGQGFFNIPDEVFNSL